MTLAALTLRALLSLTSPQAITPAITELSEAITAAAEEADGAPFTGPHRVPLLALALVSTAAGESAHFDPDVLSCARLSPTGAATAFQLLGSFGRGGHTVTEVCASKALAAREAARVLRLGAERCGLARAWTAYAVGRCEPPSRLRKHAGPKARRLHRFEVEAYRAGLGHAARWRRLAREAWLSEQRGEP